MLSCTCKAPWIVFKLDLALYNLFYNIFQEIRIIEKLLMISFINIKDINCYGCHAYERRYDHPQYQLRKVGWLGEHFSEKGWPVECDQVRS